MRGYDELINQLKTLTKELSNIRAEKAQDDINDKERFDIVFLMSLIAFVSSLVSMCISAFMFFK